MLYIASLHGAAETESKRQTPKKKSTAAVQKPLMPTYAAYKSLHTLLACVGQEMDKRDLQEQKAWYNFIDHADNQTEAGFFLEVTPISGGLLDSLWTPFGEIALAREYGPLEHTKLAEVTAALNKRFSTKFYKKSEGFFNNDIYRVQAIDGNSLPAARLRKKPISAEIVAKYWNDFSERAYKEKRQQEEIDKQMKLKALASRENDEKDGWVFVPNEK